MVGSGNVLNLTLSRGAGHRVIIDCQDSNGDPADITGWDFELLVFTPADNATVLLLEQGNGLEIDGAQATFQFTAENTSGLTAGADYRYTILVTPDDREPSYLCAGVVSVQDYPAGPSPSSNEVTLILDGPARIDLTVTI